MVNQQKKETSIQYILTFYEFFYQKKLLEQVKTDEPIQLKKRVENALLRAIGITENESHEISLLQHLQGKTEEELETASAQLFKLDGKKDERVDGKIETSLEKRYGIKVRFFSQPASEATKETEKQPIFVTLPQTMRL